MPPFVLHPDLAGKTRVCTLPLSLVLAESQVSFPWVFLVPRRAGLAQLTDLDVTDEPIFWHELRQVSVAIKQHFPCERINIAAIGNRTPQLHMHVVARRMGDALWPDVVWNRPLPTHTPAQWEAHLAALRTALQPLELAAR